MLVFFFFSSRRRHTRCGRDWSSDVCSSDLLELNSREVVPIGVVKGGQGCLIEKGSVVDVKSPQLLDYSCHENQPVGRSPVSVRGRKLVGVNCSPCGRDDHKSEKPDAVQMFLRG